MQPNDPNVAPKTMAQIGQELAKLGFKPNPLLSRSKTEPKNPGPFTENERALLLRGVVEALLAKGPNAFDFPIDFRVWAKHGLSRIYFQHDGSWLAYSTTGTAIYGVGLEGTNPKGSIAYGVRTALGLSKAAKKGAIKAEG